MFRGQGDSEAGRDGRVPVGTDGLCKWKSGLAEAVNLQMCTQVISGCGVAHILNTVDFLLPDRLPGISESINNTLNYTSWEP